MRNIFLFIRRYFNFLLFLLLQALSVYFIIHYSKYHEAAFGNFSNQFTGKINDRYSNIENYFQLKKTNDSLVKANEALYNKLKTQYELPDSSTRTVIDSIRTDSILKYRKFTYRNARVAANSVSSQNNYIVLSKGRSQNFKENMGVVDINNNLVGKIIDLSNDYSVVMSLLHKDSKISARLKKTGETGTLTWDGKEPNMVILSGIARGVRIAKGDTVMTSGFSTSFPKDLVIGRVEGVYTESGVNSYKIRVHTAANFYNLQYVYVIENVQSEGVNKILEQVKAKQ